MKENLKPCHNQKPNFDFLSNCFVLLENKAVGADLIRGVGMGFGMGLLGGGLNPLGVLLVIRESLRSGDGLNLGSPVAKVASEEDKGD